jgi:hypothetical protein
VQLNVAIAAVFAAIAWSQASPRPEKLEPFRTFLANAKAARASAFVGQPGFAVESPAAFAEMKAHVLDFYRGVTARNSFIGSDGQIVDCIPIDRQPGLQPGRPRATVSEDIPRHVVSVSGSQRDRLGNEMFCQPGTVPIVRLTLERLAKFRTLAAFLAK